MENDTKKREKVIEIENDIKETVQDVNVEVKASCPDLENKFLLVRVGTDANPAKGPEIEDVRNQLEKLLKDNNINCLTFVTHHAVAVDIIRDRGV